MTLMRASIPSTFKNREREGKERGPYEEEGILTHHLEVCDEFGLLLLLQLIRAILFQKVCGLCTDKNEDEKDQCHEKGIEMKQP